MYARNQLVFKRIWPAFRQEIVMIQIVLMKAIEVRVKLAN